jgi:hypothetical protein
MDLTERAKEAISEKEVEFAQSLGFQVTRCAACRLPTLWKVSTRTDTLAPPKTCGRMECGEVAHEPWAARKA